MSGTGSPQPPNEPRLETGERSALVVEVGELRKLAEAATPGPWELVVSPRNDERDWDEWFVGFQRGAGQVWFVEDSTSMNEADAAFIAACDPATVLALLDALDAFTTPEASPDV